MCADGTSLLVVQNFSCSHAEERVESFFAYRVCTNTRDFVVNACRNVTFTSNKFK